MSFLGRSKFLLVYGYDPVKWAKRYNIEPFTHPCGGCGRLMTTSIAFVSGPCRGLVAPQCDCGQNPPYCIVGDWGELFPVSKPTHKSSGARIRQPCPIPTSRRCRYKSCLNKVTHVGLIEGTIVTIGCEWHIAGWVRSGKPPTPTTPLRSA